jgi:DNA polymerase V
MQEVFGIIDCNNFYVSCERVFRPDLEGKPVIVLSNNDGCCVARSQEVKNLGVKMGDPVFKIRDLIKRENITLFSSNYAYYGDISNRVVQTLGSMVPTIETYSIDESFLNLGDFHEREVEPLARELRERVHRWVGIPTCVGIAPTKTLAKVANFIAKKRPQYRGVCDLRSASLRAELLPTVPVDEVWGIGGASAAKLSKLGVQTAADLAALNPDDARALMTVTGGRSVYELRGVSCLPLELMEPTRKGIAVTRSFGAPVTSWEPMREAIASYATRAAEKMRRYKVAAENIFVFIHTSTFNNEPFYSNGASARFFETTNDTGEVVVLAVRLGERLWRDGFRYMKCGVMITELVPETIRQPALWGELDREKRERAWRAMDKLNATLGRDTVRILGAGPKDAAWKLRAEHRSPRWTTRWDELPHVLAR